MVDVYSKKETRINEIGKKYLKWISDSDKINKKIFRSKEDPMYEVQGSAFVSHPKEVEKMIRVLESWGINIEYTGNLGYGCTRYGYPGTISISKEASYSAWLHEFEHAQDDMEHGWDGVKVLWCDPEERERRERKAYEKEIEFALSLGREDIAERLQKNLEEEVAKIYAEKY